MDAKDHLVISVLGDQRRFMVPIYQRQYSWREDRLDPFWEDVVAKAEEALSGAPRFSHYMGALILAPGADGFTVGATPKVLVVDGQQRLTTFQLFLSALREVALKLDCAEIKPMVETYLYVPPMHGDNDPDAKYRLVPTPEDRSVFHLLIDHGLAGIRTAHPEWFFGTGRLIKGAAPLAVKAFAHFADRIEEYAVSGIMDQSEGDQIIPDVSETPNRRLHALLQAVLNHLKLVVITLSETDDAQVIFETLNSKAEPLLAMDLVRNNIFHRASAQGESAEALFDAKWRPFDRDGGFWKADSPRAKPKRPRIDHFLSHALTAQTGEETSLRELYAEYRAFTRPKGKPRFATVEAELDALVAYAPIYKSLEIGGGDERLARLGAKLNLWEVSTAYPLVFQIAASDAQEQEKANLYDLIYSYLVRRAVCGLTSKNMNKTFATMTGVMIRDGVSVRAFAAVMAEFKGDATRFPDDDELRTAMRSKPIYQMIGRKERLADMLWDLESAARNKYNVNTARPDFLSVEHVLPQTWRTTWSLPDGSMAPADALAATDESMASAIAAREGAVHRIGNLTLITMPGNVTASNRPFNEKKPWLLQSLLALNLTLAERDDWNEDAITERADALADLAVQVWPALPTAGTTQEPDLPAAV